jgi:hypothetical protein
LIHIIQKKRQQWYGHVKRGGENTIINYGMDTRGEKKKRTFKKNVDGRSTSTHESQKFRICSMEK